MKLALFVLAALVGGAIPVSAQSFADDFNTGKLALSEWTVSNDKAPQGGAFDPSNVDLSGGMLALRVTQSRGPNGVVSSGGEIVSNRLFGYGTYEFTMRMGSTSATPDGPGKPVSGSVSAGFSFIKNSQTEIDIEFTGNDPDNVHQTTWINPVPENKPTLKETHACAMSGLAESFHTYGYVWYPGHVEWYIDGKLITVHKKNVPNVPAHIILNHWGTDSDGWGGTATPGTRYMYVKKVKFTPWEGH
jgi:beta-glucanase (GH16 family)